MQEERHAKVRCCPECGSSRLMRDYDLAEIVCMTCGFVVAEKLADRGPEWRAFTPEEIESKTRVGAPTSFSVYDKGLSTSIPYIGRDAFGRKLSAETQAQMWRLRKWQIRLRAHSTIEKNLAQTMNKLNNVCDKDGIPKKVKESAARIYRKALNEGLIRGRSIEAMAYAALYAACRISKTPRTLKEISKYSSYSKKDIGRHYRILLKELDILIPVEDPLTYLSKIAEKAGISGKSQGLAVRIIHEAKRIHYISGKGRTGVDAAALYLACLLNEEKKTQYNIAKAAGVTEVTVRNRYKGLKEELSSQLEDWGYNLSVF